MRTEYINETILYLKSKIGIGEVSKRLRVYCTSNELRK